MVATVHSSRSEEYPWETRCYGCERMNYVRHDLLGREVGCVYCGALLTVSGVSPYPSAIPGESVNHPEHQGAKVAPPVTTVRVRDRFRPARVYVQKPGVVALVISAMFVVFYFVTVATAAGFGRHYARLLMSLLR